jgi:peptidyl-prolyl cis-trans isomerase SurA
MKLLNLFAALVIFTTLSFSAFSQDKKATILTIQGENITLEEFENIFRKNNRDSVITQKSLDDYMELFINFKLKVREAKALGLDTVAKFKTELEGYRATLARPYLTDTDMLNGMMREAYDRSKQEVRASHILINCDPSASPEDTLKAYNRAMEARKKILDGAKFDATAKEYSQDPSAKDNGGDLGYFTVFQMVYQFEDGAYSTPVGQVSMPVRTRYGYHVIKVTDKRTARGEIHVAHIMVKEKKEENGAANASAKAKEIYDKAMAGESFTDLAAKYSDDGSTSKSGGELPWFGTNKMVAEFEEAAFSLKNDGDISAPIKTSYGWHIIKRLGYRTIGTFEESEKKIKSDVSRDGRSEKTKNSFVSKLKKEYKFTYDEKLVNEMAATADTSVFKGTWNVSSKLLKKPMFTIDGKKYPASEFHKVITDRMKIRTKQSPADYIRSEAKVYAENALLKHEDTKLEGKHDAFRLLMNEYREGILLFELTDQKVWSKAVKDSTGLQNFYDNNKSKFMWPERIDVTFYTCANEQIAAKVRELIAQGVSNSDIASQINKDTQLNIQIEEGVYAKEDRDILENVAWKKGLSMNIPYNGQFVIANVKDVIASTPKKFSECRGLVTSEYQNYLEEQWIKELRTKYSSSINKQVLHSIK